MRASDLVHLETDLPTTAEDVEALRRARRRSRVTPADLSALLRQFGTLSYAQLRARRGVQGEPFEL